MDAGEYYKRQALTGRGIYLPVFRGRGLYGRGFLSDLWKNVLYPMVVGPILKGRIIPSVKRGAQDLFQDIRQGKKVKTSLKQRAKETLKRTLTGRGRRKIKRRRK